METLTAATVEQWGIFVNVYGDTVFRNGGKLLLMYGNGDNESFMFTGLNHQGRPVEKYVRLSRVKNWRVGMVPPGQAVRYLGYNSREEAQSYLDRFCPIENPSP